MSWIPRFNIFSNDANTNDRGGTEHNNQNIDRQIEEEQQERNSVDEQQDRISVADSRNDSISVRNNSSVENEDIRNEVEDLDRQRQNRSRSPEIVDDPRQDRENDQNADRVMNYRYEYSYGEVSSPNHNLPSDRYRHREFLDRSGAIPPPRGYSPEHYRASTPTQDRSDRINRSNRLDRFDISEHRTERETGDYHRSSYRNVPTERENRYDRSISPIPRNRDRPRSPSYSRSVPRQDRQTSRHNTTSNTNYRDHRSVSPPTDRNPPRRSREPFRNSPEMRRSRRRVIQPYPDTNADIMCSTDSSSSDSEFELGSDSDTDSIGETLKSGKYDNKYIMKKLKKFNKGLRDLKRVEQGRLFSDNLTKVPKPSFPKGIRYRSINSSEDLKIIDFNFPRNKFSGNPKTKKNFDLDVYEFLSTMVEGQKHCPVSKKDFIRLLVARLAPPALGMVNGWLMDKNCSINKIFSRLFKTFSSSISTIEARNLLRLYLMCRNMTFDQALSEMQYLADYASRGYNNNRENALAITFAFQDGLEHALPIAAYKLCYNQIIDLRRYLGREPYLGEIIDALRQIADKVDYELKHTKNHNWAKDRDFLDFSHKQSRSNLISNESSKPKSGFPYQNKSKKFVNELTVHATTTSTAPKPKYTPSPNHQKSNIKGKGQGKGNFKNNTPAPKMGPQKASEAKDKKYCSYCGSHTHTAAQGCWAIVDENLKMYQGPPAQEPCRICIRNCDKEFKHPERFCPLRKFMVDLYKAGRIKAKGIFKIVLERLNYQVK